jgi:pyruvate/2-oxoglutarate dehydrogenase complex dihydrolipoamide dehydrogenase (E3) component
VQWWTGTCTNKDCVQHRFAVAENTKLRAWQHVESYGYEVTSLKRDLDYQPHGTYVFHCTPETEKEA